MQDEEDEEDTTDMDELEDEQSLIGEKQRRGGTGRPGKTGGAATKAENSDRDANVVGAGGRESGSGAPLTVKSVYPPHSACVPTPIGRSVL